MMMMMMTTQNKLDGVLIISRGLNKKIIGGKIDETASR
jgi:hypothetical protein